MENDDLVDDLDELYSSLAGRKLYISECKKFEEDMKELDKELGIPGHHTDNILKMHSHHQHIDINYNRKQNGK